VAADRFDLHGLGIAVHCEHEGAAAALRARLGSLRAAAGESDLAFDIRIVGTPAGHLPQPAGRLRPVYESASGRALYADEGDELWLECGDAARARCLPAAGRCEATVVGGRPGLDWLVSHPLFTIPLIEMAKRRGLYSVHAAGAALGGRGLLLAGPSGAGKSTLALALARAGAGYLGDDVVFLRGGDVLAFPEAVDVVPGTSELLPWLATAPARPGWPKRQVAASDLPGPGPVDRCRPSVVVLVRVARGAISALLDIAPHEAFIELAPNILLTESASCQAHMDALGALLADCACYRLETGRDLASAAALLRGLLPR
jgi:hypothetical protein